MATQSAEHEPSSVESESIPGALRAIETEEPDTPRILVVDDHRHVCKLLTLQLTSDYEVVAVTSFDQAVGLAWQQSFSAAILDIDLGEERSGFDLLKELRAIPGHERLPAIACTEYTPTESRERFLKAGFNGYIGKPFRKERVLAALRDILDPLSGPSALEKISFKLPLPPLSATFPGIVQLLSRKENVPDTDRLVEILGKDPVVSLWVIQHVNSSYFSLVHKVSSIQRAVLMLGFDPVCNLVLTEAVARTFSTLNSPKAVRVYRQIMKTSVGTAAFARLLGYQLGMPRPETAFTAGLLHQLGRFVLLSCDTKRYCSLWQDPESGGRRSGGLCIRPTAELETYGTDYARLGADVGRKWQLAEELLVAIRYHTDPEGNPYKRHRILTLLVAAGHEAATETFGPSTHRRQAQAKNLDQATPLGELARLFRVKPEKLAAVLREKEADVRTFVNDIVS